MEKISSSILDGRWTAGIAVFFPNRFRLTWIRIGYMLTNIVTGCLHAEREVMRMTMWCIFCPSVV